MITEVYSLLVRHLSKCPYSITEYN